MTDNEIIGLLMNNTQMSKDDFWRFCLHYRTRDVSTVIEYIRSIISTTHVAKILPEILRTAMNTYIKQYETEYAV